MGERDEPTPDHTLVPALLGARILVLDDELHAQASLERVLISLGADVLCAGSVDHAKKLLEIFEVDAAVIDYWLLEGDVGTAAVKHLRRGERPCASLMITGERKQALTISCIEEGAFDVLLKPFDTETFVERIFATVQRTRSWRARIADGDEDDGMPLGFRTHGDPLTVTKLLEESEVSRIREYQLAADRVADYYKLSGKEIVVFKRVILGESNKEIAEKTGIAERTVKFHIGNIRKKSNCRNRSELILLVFFHQEN